ncbi:transcriptional regulator [Desulfobaculum senezii]
MRIACVGPSDSIAVMQEAVERYFPDVTFIMYVREKTEDSWEVLESCQREADGILFSGIGVQEAAKARGIVTKPYAHIPRGAYSLMRVLSEISRSGLPHGRISIDVVLDNVLHEVIREFGISFDKIHSMPFAIHRREDDYLERHLDLYHSGKVDVMVTGFGSVYHQLSGMELPAFRMYPSALQVRETVERLIGMIDARGLRSAGIAIQNVKLNGISQDSINQYDDMKNKGRFYLELLEYVRAIQGSIFNFGKEEYVIFSTRGVIESEVHMDMFRRLLEWGRRNNILFASGIGIGGTAFEAEKSARKALSNAIRLPQGGLFIVNGDHMRGPVGEEGEIAFRTRVSDEASLRASREIGISASHVEKIRALMDKTGKDTFDSGDLAARLGIGERSARRLLKKFLDSGYAELVGKETAHHVGRPKNVVRILL